MIKAFVSRCGTFILALTLGFFLMASPAQAGTDLTVACAVLGGGCAISPNGTPLFDETNILPGDTFQQVVTAQNTGSQDGTFAIESLNLTNTGTGVQLSDAITIEVRQGSATGPTVLGPITLTEFIDPDPEFYLLSRVNAGSTEQFYFLAEFDFNAGNEYQGLESVFDLRLGFELISNGDNSDDGGSDDGGDDGNDGGSTSNPGPPTCEAQAPTSAPNVSISNVGANTVTLTWTPVSPVTHYGIIFNRNSDGEQYGSPNVGNVTSYTVTNLSGGGASYTFRVFGVNDCEPGPVSGGVNTGIVPGPVISSRPVGDDGQVLGVEDDAKEQEEEAEPQPEEQTGEVAGAATCVTWKLYIPWILLIAQGVLILANEYYFRDKKGMTKHYVTIGITLASIFIFYLVRECDCYTGSFWLAWLCKWYWLVALLLSLFIRGFSYAFMEEVDEKKEPHPPSSSSKVAATSEVNKPASKPSESALVVKKDSSSKKQPNTTK